MKVCCVGDATVCPVDSSCSMILRSACTHRHSHESSVDREKSLERSQRRKQVSETKFDGVHHRNVSVTKACNGTHQSGSALEYSFKKLPLDLEKSLSIKSRIYSTFAFTDSIGNRVSDASVLGASCVKELRFHELSSDSSNLSFENAKECNYSSSSKSFNASSDVNNDKENMSRLHRYTRSSTSSRSLCDSDNEDTISIYSIRRPKKSTYSLYSNSSVKDSDSALTHNSKSANNSAINHSSLSSNDSGRYSDSSFDKFRWFFWRYEYLKVVKTINFDVWLPSRFYQYGKCKVIFILLLPLLLYLLWGVIQNSSTTSEVLPLNFMKSTFSYLSSFLSSVLTAFLHLFMSKEDTVASPGIAEMCSSYFSSLIGMFGAIPSLFYHSSTVEKSTETKASDHMNMDYNIVPPNKEDLESITSKILKDELEAMRKIQILEKSVMLEKKENQKLKEEIKNLRIEFQSVSETMKNMENNVKLLSKKTTDDIVFSSNHKKSIDDLQQKMKTIETKIEQWNLESISAILEMHIATAFKNVMENDNDPTSKYGDFNEWLNSKFLNREKLAVEISNAVAKLNINHKKESVDYDTVVKIVKGTVSKYMESVKENLTRSNEYNHVSFDDLFSEDHIKKIVKQALMVYDADKTGKVDYALESGGGSVLSTRCSETYMENNGKLSIFGLPLWTMPNSPRTAIQPDMQPGRCWAFKGNHGFLVIELSATIYPTGFTLEHIPVSLSPTGTIDSAPKNFSVWGLSSEKDNKGVLLGEYWYDSNGEPLQYFEVQKLSDVPYSYIELQIYSNHGNINYTCLYRFRVHGRRA